MPTVLITGASRGLGLEFCRQYAADGWRVHACARDARKAAQGVSGDVVRHQLDVLSDADCADVAKALEAEGIDLLINNAGIYGPRDATFGRLNYAVWDEVMRVNVLAPLRVCEVLVDAVERSDKKVLAFVTSRMGSIGEHGGGGGYIYRTSKTALNMAVKCLAGDVKARGISCAVIHPGWVRTDMGGPSATLSPEESVTGMRKVLAGVTLAGSGSFLNYDGAQIPW
jgi:NAD(P)-dependent dehydrogenase (short-subunit alcohol dehydrogenase family)